MYSKAFSVAIQGIDGRIIQIEADISDGLPNFSLVGYLSSEAKEARERVRVALKNSGFRIPPKKVTINLSPADIRKDGTRYDLAIAISILSAFGSIPKEALSKLLLIGELSLDGQLKPVSGILPMVHTAKAAGFTYCILPEASFREGCVVEGINCIGASSLTEVIQILQSQIDDYVVKNVRQSLGVHENTSDTIPDFSEIRGQEVVRRAIEVGVSGMHNLMMIGPPGSGKTMMAKSVAGIMPPPDLEEQMEISKIYSVAGLLNANQPIMNQRPFRAPHHTITQTALVGGGRYPQPGEISLASGGVLFLDELPEFQRQSIEVLRQPLEDGWVTVSRLSGSCRYPAKALLMVAMNPCPCGYFPNRSKCHCTTMQIQKYLSKISHPLLDRIDICTETISLTYEELEHSGKKNESSASIRSRVMMAQDIQKERYQKESFQFNSQLGSQKIRKYCQLTKEAKEYLEKIFCKMEFSARAYHKVLKVGRTIADLAGSEQIQLEHICEAVCYRSVDRKYWEGEVD